MDLSDRKALWVAEIGWQFGEKWSVSASIEDISGTLIDVLAGVSFRPTNNIGIGIGVN